MKYFLFQDNKLVDIVTECPFTGTPQLKEIIGSANEPVEYNSAKSRNDFTNFEEVEDLAEEATKLTGETWIATNDSDYRFNVMQLPKIGDEVSYSFNGDTYPCGKIVAITSKYQVTTSTGKKFRRVKETGGWRMTGGTWWMVSGHHYEQNPHF